MLDAGEDDSFLAFLGLIGFFETVLFVESVGVVEAVSELGNAWAAVAVSRRRGAVFLGTLDGRCLGAILPLVSSPRLP